MCTVTYIPTRNGFLLTSNRDEKILRSPALPPALYAFDGAKLLYPKDPAAEGTWIALHEAGQAAVLLNGGFRKHEPQYPYRKSRGVIFLEIVAGGNPESVFKTIDLHQIEPFTLIEISEKGLIENRWDGQQKFTTPLKSDQPHIWSSVTLYDERSIRQRKDWFSAWIKENPNPTAKQIRQFHLFGGNGDLQNGIRINRNNEMLTVSVTSIEYDPETALMHYTDLQTGISSEQTLRFNLAPEKQP